jgi:8-amino-7-oxononanoate synthase
VLSSRLDERLQGRLDTVRERGLWRTTRILDGPQAPEQIIDGRPMVAFCSNDYLGLASDPRVVAAVHEGLDRYGLGAGAAHLVNGHTRAHEELEEVLAAFTRRPAALLFSTGYMANLGMLQTLTERHDEVFEDRLNHASLIDAVRLAGVHVRRYRHADPEDLERRLSAAASGRPRFVVTDGVFSMDGDLAPLPALARTARNHGATLVVDDAHGLGVLGERGDGSCGHFGLGAEDVPVLMGTLGKAVGSAGAFVAGSATVIESLRQFARSYVYTTAMPAALAVGTRVAVGLVETESWRRERLNRLVARLRQGLRQIGLPPGPGWTPIQPVLLGSARAASTVAAALYDNGLLVPAIRPPTVPEGTARLRITLSARHTDHQVDRLVETLQAVMRALPADTVPQPLSNASQNRDTIAQGDTSECP